jgi:hypothetical protein
LQIVKINVLAALFGVTERQCRNLLSEAGVQPVNRGEWDLVRAVRGVFNRLREARTSSEVAKARTRQIEAVARKHELATKRAERDLIPVEDAQAAIDLVMGKVVSELSGLPARVTRDISVRRKMETELNEARMRMVEAITASATFLAEGGALPYSSDED